MWADVEDRHGVLRRIQLGTIRPDAKPVTFNVKLGGSATALWGFQITTRVSGDANTYLKLAVRGLAAVTSDGDRAPLRLASDWRAENTELDVTVKTTDPIVRVSDHTVSVTTHLNVTLDWMARYFGAVPEFGLRVLPRAAFSEPIGAVVTPQLLRQIGDSRHFTLPMSNGEVRFAVVGVIESVPGVDNELAALVDLPTLTSYGYAELGVRLQPTEWWLTADADKHASVAAAVGKLDDTRTVDRLALAEQLTREPLGAGARVALLPAALAVALLAGLGITVDVRAAARQRSGELAVLHTLGSAPRQLARSLVAEQAVLAGLGVVTGVGVGLLVAWLMGPLLVLTPDAAKPIPPAVLVADPVLIALPALGLLAVAFGLAASVAAGVRRNLAANVLRIGDGR